MALDPELAARLATARGAPSGPAAEPCPEPGSLAALVDGQVAEAERPALEAHLSRCEPCLDTLLAINAERPEARLASPAPPALERVAAPARPHRAWLHRARPRPAWAAAALVILAVGLYALLAQRSAPPAPGTVLEQAVARIASRAPELAREVADLTPAERAALVPPPARGGVRALLPQGLVLDGRPRLRVVPVPGANGYSLRVADPEGRSVAVATLAAPDAAWPAELPDLAPGREYVATIEARGPLGLVRALGAFRTASAAERSEAARVNGLLEGAGSGGVPALLRARRLLRLEAYEAAEGELVRALDDPGLRPAAEALLAALRARIGP